MSDYQSLCRTLNQVLRPPVEAVNKLIDKLYDENKELRALVRELYEDQCADGDQWKYRDRMRELGIEV